MKKKTVSSFIVVAMLLAVSLYFVGGTYARYASTFEGNATVQVAKWNVAVKNGETDLQTKDFALQLTPDENEFVAKDRIAPATTASGKISVDLTGTEVAVDIKVEVTETDLENVFGAGGAEAKVTVKVGEDEYNAVTDENGKLVALVGSSAFTGEDGKRDITISVEWPNDDANNETDTATGKTGGTITIPVKLTVQQHIEVE